MSTSGWTPSIVPRDDDQDVYLVLDDFGILGRSWRETDELDAPKPTVPVVAGAFRIGSGARTMKKCVAPLERFGPATPATPPWEVPRLPPPASAAEP